MRLWNAYFYFYRNVLLPLLTVSYRYFLHHARTLISGAKREQVFVSILLFHPKRNFILLFHSSLLRQLQESIHLFSTLHAKLIDMSTIGSTYTARKDGFLRKQKTSKSINQPVFTCSTSTMKAAEQCMKSV